MDFTERKNSLLASVMLSGGLEGKKVSGAPLWAASTDWYLSQVAPVPLSLPSGSPGANLPKARS
jgi:hypothetical protein